jgi:serine/threonine protein kinase
MTQLELVVLPIHEDHAGDYRVVLSSDPDRTARPPYNIEGLGVRHSFWAHPGPWPCEPNPDSTSSVAADRVAKVAEVRHAVPGERRPADLMHREIGAYQRLWGPRFGQAAAPEIADQVTRPVAFIENTEVQLGGQSLLFRGVVLERAGRSLDTYLPNLPKQGWVRLTAGQRVRLARAVALCLLRVLPAIHRCNVVHGDVRPHNLLLRNDEDWILQSDLPALRLTDFSNCSITTEQTNPAEHPMAGHESYRCARPLGRSRDRRDDLYAAAVTIHVLLHDGALPYRADGRQLAHPDRQAVAQAIYERNQPIADGETPGPAVQRPRFEFNVLTKLADEPSRDVSDLVDFMSAMITDDLDLLWSATEPARLQRHIKAIQAKAERASSDSGYQGTDPIPPKYRRSSTPPSLTRASAPAPIPDSRTRRPPTAVIGGSKMAPWTGPPLINVGKLTLTERIARAFRRTAPVPVPTRTAQPTTSRQGSNSGSASPSLLVQPISTTELPQPTAVAVAADPIPDTVQAPSSPAFTPSTPPPDEAEPATMRHEERIELLVGLACLLLLVLAAAGGVVGVTTYLRASWFPRLGDVVPRWLLGHPIAQMVLGSLIAAVLNLTAAYAEHRPFRKVVVGTILTTIACAVPPVVGLAVAAATYRYFPTLNWQASTWNSGQTAVATIPTLGIMLGLLVIHPAAGVVFGGEFRLPWRSAIAFLLVLVGLGGTVAVGPLAYATITPPAGPSGQPCTTPYPLPVATDRFCVYRVTGWTEQAPVTAAQWVKVAHPYQPALTLTSTQSCLTATVSSVKGDSAFGYVNAPGYQAQPVASNGRPVDPTNASLLFRWTEIAPNAIVGLHAKTSGPVVNSGLHDLSVTSRTHYYRLVGPAGNANSTIVDVDVNEAGCSTAAGARRARLKLIRALLKAVSPATSSCVDTPTYDTAAGSSLAALTLASHLCVELGSSVSVKPSKFSDSSAGKDDGLLKLTDKTGSEDYLIAGPVVPNRQPCTGKVIADGWCPASKTFHEQDVLYKVFTAGTQHIAVYLVASDDNADKADGHALLLSLASHVSAR